MAYSLPELVLVGAAQNLVLGTSDIKLVTALCEGTRPQDEDFVSGEFYNEEPPW